MKTNSDPKPRPPTVHCSRSITCPRRAKRPSASARSRKAAMTPSAGFTGARDRRHSTQGRRRDAGRALRSAPWWPRWRGRRPRSRKAGTGGRGRTRPRDSRRALPPGWRGAAPRPASDVRANPSRAPPSGEGWAAHGRETSNAARARQARTSALSAFEQPSRLAHEPMLEAQSSGEEQRTLAWQELLASRIRHDEASVLAFLLLVGLAQARHDLRECHSRLDRHEGIEDAPRPPGSLTKHLAGADHEVHVPARLAGATTAPAEAD